jgi:hypothetical protein
VHHAHRRPRPAAQAFIDWLLAVSAPERSPQDDATRTPVRRGRAR